MITVLLPADLSTFSISGPIRNYTDSKVAIRSTEVVYYRSNRFFHNQWKSITCISSSSHHPELASHLATTPPVPTATHLGIGRGTCEEV